MSGVSRQQDAPRVAIATNNGDVGGGEVMLLAIADALRDCGLSVTVVAPSEPGELAALAAERGFAVEVLEGSGRRGYMLALARWRLHHRDLPLWCNGLVPSLATAGMGPRIVHVHILPGRAHRIAWRIAGLNARRTVTVSRFMGDRIPGSTVLENWTGTIPRTWGRRPDHAEPFRIGFLGRLTRDKGVHDLARAVALLRSRGHEVRLILAGDGRFGDAEDEREISTALLPLGDAVELLGWVRSDAFLSDVDMAVFPSRWEEPFGLVVAEAMAVGVPFVITESGALPEVAGPSHPWVARPGDPESLADAIGAARAAIEAGATEVLDEARSRWEDHYSPEAGTARLAAMMRGLA